VAFTLGGSLFAAGAFLAQTGEELLAVNLTYLIGGFFFSLGGWLSILASAARSRARSSAVVLFVGTLLFAVSLVWIAVVNQLGSWLFLLAGAAAFVRPATSDPVNVALVNWGTFAGAVSFAVAGVIQMRVLGGRWGTTTEWDA
jgi:hypothetical protein